MNQPRSTCLRAARAALAGAALVLAACGGGKDPDRKEDPGTVAPAGIYRGTGRVDGRGHHMAVTADGRFLGYTFEAGGHEVAHSLIAGQGRSRNGVWTLTPDRAFACPGSRARPHEAVRTPAEGRRQEDRFHITWKEGERAYLLDLAVPQDPGPARALEAGTYTGEASLLFHQVPEDRWFPFDLELVLAAGGGVTGRLASPQPGLCGPVRGTATLQGSWRARTDLPAYDLTVTFASPDLELSRLLAGRPFTGMAMPDPVTGALRCAVLAAPGGQPDLAVAGKVTRKP